MSRDETRFDLFVSYAHKDDEGTHAGQVTALVQAIRDEYHRVTLRELRVFFDQDDIGSMDDWEHRILRGLRESKVMLAVLSTAYFDSAYCRKEWERYVEHELQYALPGEGIAPLYVITHPAFDAYDVHSDADRWMQDLKRRQYLELVEFWPQGIQALELDDVRRRIEKLEKQIADRLK